MLNAVSLEHNFCLAHCGERRKNIITKVKHFTFSYKTSLSSQSPRRNKSGLSSNKNKLLRDENKGFDNKDDTQPLVSHPSYWSTNENVKRSQQQVRPESGENNGYSPDVSIKDYLADAAVAPNALDDVAYLDDDDSPDYDLNGYFNSVNQDNINDFYLYINQLLSKKPNQKTI